MNWPSYNQSLVRRGEILIGFDVINNWDAELKEMNKYKVGETFQYQDTFLLLLGYAKVISSTLSSNQRRHCTREGMLNGRFHLFPITRQ